MCARSYAEVVSRLPWLGSTPVKRNTRRRVAGTGEPGGHAGPNHGDGKRRILHVAQPVEAGVAVVVRELVRHQIRLGWDVAVACPRGGSLPTWVREAGADVLAWSARRQPGPAVIPEVAALRRLVRTWAPDLVHLHSSKAGLAGRLAIRGRTPTIYQPHAWSFLAVQGIARVLSTGWERVSVRWTDAIACVSAGEQADGERRGVRGNWYLCPNGIDLEFYHPASGSERAAARLRLGLRSEHVVVCVGRLCEQKGQDVLLAAWGRLPPTPGTVLVLVGDGPYRTILKRSSVDNVIFAGNVEFVMSWYHAASLLVQPSRWEAGASLTVREAMACGLSVVATDVPGVRELVERECGAVVAVGDPIALADAIHARLSDPDLRVSEGIRGRQVAQRDLRLSDALAHVDAMYADVLRHRT